MKKFLQSPWGAATVTASFFLVIMGGVAVMAKSMIDSRFAEASKVSEAKTPAKGHDDHKHGTGHGENHGAGHATDQGENHGTGHATGHGENHGAGHTTDHGENHETGHTTDQGEKHGIEHATDHGEKHGTGHPADHGENHGAEHSTSHEDEPKTPLHTESHGTVPEAPHGAVPLTVPLKAPDIIITTTEGAPSARLNHPDDGHANDSHGHHGGQAEALAQPKPAESHGADPHWSYEGKTGPFGWHKIKSDWAIAKAGIRQSPINIIPEDALTLPTLKRIEFHYSGGLHLLKDNGHTIQVDIKNDKNYIIIDGQKYQLLQFHFHAMSEHEINGDAAKMELHLVHKLVKENDHGTLGDSCIPAPEGPAETHKKPKPQQDQLAVIGVMIESGPDPHPFIKDLWSDLSAVKPNDGGIRFRLDGPISLLPPEGKRSYYRYNGSLTTPPCSENVLWTVMAEPIQFSDMQIKAFTNRYSSNARPVMEKKRRFVLKFEDKRTGPVIRATPALPGGGLVPGNDAPSVPSSFPKPHELLPGVSTNAPTIGVRGGTGLPLPGFPGIVPAPQPR